MDAHFKLGSMVLKSEYIFLEAQLSQKTKDTMDK